MTTDELLTDILRREGGYVDHPFDRGGPTNMGITFNTFQEWRHEHPTREIINTDALKRLTEAEAREIYKAKYVDLPGIGTLPDGPLIAQVVDYGVHSGPHTAIKELQRVLGVTADGIIGPITRGKVAMFDQERLSKDLLRRRMERFVDIVKADNTQLKFLRGWVRRALEFL